MGHSGVNLAGPERLHVRLTLEGLGPLISVVAISLVLRRHTPAVVKALVEPIAPAVAAIQAVVAPEEEVGCLLGGLPPAPVMMTMVVGTKISTKRRDSVDGC